MFGKRINPFKPLSLSAIREKHPSKNFEAQKGGNGMNQGLCDTVIIGGGPAAAASAVYAGRKKLKTLLITEKFGGQSIVSSSIENWIGELSVSGMELSEKLRRHVSPCAETGE